MGLFNWLANTPKRLGQYGRKVVAGEEIEKSGKYIADLATNLQSKSDRQETFENAYVRLGMTEEKLQEAYAYYTNRFLMFSFFFGLAIILALYLLFTKDIIGSVAVLGFMAVCVSQLFHSSFRMYQMRQRELLPVSEWLKHPHEWWTKPLPPKNPPSGRSKSLPTISKSKTK